MPTEDTRAALTAVYCSILSAVDLATGKPASALAGQIMRGIAAETEQPYLAELLVGLAEAGEEIDAVAELEASDA